MAKIVAEKVAAKEDSKPPESRETGKKVIIPISYHD
jgi:hypothetical protein